MSFIEITLKSRLFHLLITMILTFSMNEGVLLVPNEFVGFFSIEKWFHRFNLYLNQLRSCKLHIYILHLENNNNYY